uniref:Receptor-binding cancer antigen expressed on SiSo cells n=1 Tax=Panagrolaimus sp. JU765 TaxID=591449 RepID=A0AC34QQT2_9BILA
MSAVGKVVATVLGILFFLLNCVTKLVNAVTGRKEKRIGELDLQPTAVISDGHSVSHRGSASSWENWTDKSFGVESKIDEYRRKQQETAEKKKMKETTAPEEDYFNDLRPEIKSAKRLDVNPGRSTPSPRKNLFEFNENDISIPMMNGTELGDLDLDETNHNQDSWDAEMDLSQMDHVFKAQRQKEREERQKQRLIEHEKRLNQKKMKL